jgi:hypothetical protein
MQERLGSGRIQFERHEDWMVLIESRQDALGRLWRDVTCSHDDKVCHAHPKENRRYKRLAATSSDMTRRDLLASIFVVSAFLMLALLLGNSAVTGRVVYTATQCSQDADCPVSSRCCGGQGAAVCAASCTDVPQAMSARGAQVFEFSPPSTSLRLLMVLCGALATSLLVTILLLRHPHETELF